MEHSLAVEVLLLRLLVKLVSPTRIRVTERADVLLCADRRTQLDQLLTIQLLGMQNRVSMTADQAVVIFETAGSHDVAFVSM